MKNSKWAHRESVARLLGVRGEPRIKDQKEANPGAGPNTY